MIISGCWHHKSANQSCILSDESIYHSILSKSLAWIRSIGDEEHVDDITGMQSVKCRMSRGCRTNTLQSGEKRSRETYSSEETYGTYQPTQGVGFTGSWLVNSWKSYGTSPVVQWLRLLPLQGAQVQSLVRKLRSCMPCGAAKKKVMKLLGKFEHSQFCY